MTVIKFKAMKAAQRKRSASVVLQQSNPAGQYASTVLQQFDRMERDAKRENAERRAEVERKARGML